jgi:hypothetical protein
MKMRQQTKTRQEPFRELKTRTPNFKIPGLGNAVSKVKKMMIESPEEFDIFVKKQGQDILLGKASSKEGAKSLLLGKISNTLRASGYVQRKSGEKIKVSDLGNLGMNFGRSKKDDFRVVEKKNKRLKRKGSSQEVSEIMSFKKSKGSKNLFKL